MGGTTRFLFWRAEWIAHSLDLWTALRKNHFGLYSTLFSRRKTCTQSFLWKFHISSARARKKEFDEKDSFGFRISIRNRLRFYLWYPHPFWLFSFSWAAIEQIAFDNRKAARSFNWNLPQVTRLACRRSGNWKDTFGEYDRAANT